MSLLRRIIRLVVQCVILCNVNLSNSDLPIENNSESSTIGQSDIIPTQSVETSDIDCQYPSDWLKRDEDNGDAVSVPPDVCGLCPTGEGDLDPCECTSMGHRLAGLISITCDASTKWTTFFELKEMFNNVHIYPTKHAFRFMMTGTNVSGSLEDSAWGSQPLDFHQIIMDNNKIKVVDNHAFYSSKDVLTLLSLKNNDIFYFHWDHLQDLPLLYTLVLQGNNISLIPTEVFPKTEITYLDLSRNVINQIGTNAFDKLHKLRKLNLSYNKLESLDENSFSISQHNPNGFNDLQIILSNNYISYISPRAFADVHPVVLDLSNNLLSTVEKDVFMPLILGNTNFISIILIGNPIVCDCSIYWMLEPYIKKLFGNFECYDEYGRPSGIEFIDLQLNNPGMDPDLPQLC